MPIQHAFRLTFLLGVTALCVAGRTPAASVPEFPTLVYGRVIARHGGREMTITSGQLTWSVRNPDSGQVVATLTADLWAIAEGQFSYRLQVPHEAQVFNADISAGVLPLPTQDETLEFVQPTLDGLSLAILDPPAARVAFSQQKRGGAVRLDLLVTATMPDSDGDGMPDWWEDAVGLDKQLDDADGDPDGDGLSNLAEFRRGSSPADDNRPPSLATDRLTVYAGSTSGLLLDALDTDSAPTELAYTVNSLPEAGSVVMLGDGVAPDRQLAPGDTFTQADVLAGRLAFSHRSDDDATSLLGLSLADEDPAHPVCNTTVTLTVVSCGLSDAFGPADSVTLLQTAWLEPSARAEILCAGFGRLGRVVWDACSRADMVVLAVCDPARAAVLRGGGGADELVGGAVADILVDSSGDDVMTGGAGSDAFVLLPGNDTDTITDFAPGDGDAIDLCAVLYGGDAPLDEVLDIAVTVDGIQLTIAGKVVCLSGLTSFDVHALLDGGNLLLPEDKAPVYVSISATAATASESGLRNGEFTLRRTGPLDNPLRVNLGIAGTAENGRDYRALPTAVDFPPGSASVAFSVEAYADASIEPPETVAVSVAGGTAYQPAGPDPAEVTITDLKPVLSLEVLEPVAVAANEVPAVVLITRQGQTAPPVDARLEIAGDARNGLDYGYIPPVVQFAAGQATRTVILTPAAGFQSDVCKTITLTLKPDPGNAYELAEPTGCDLVIAPTADLADLARHKALDADGDGLSAAQENALGTDPSRVTLVMRQGWNLVSVPLAPEPGWTIEDQFGDALGSVLGVWAYEGDQYRLLDEQAEPLAPGKGYFVCALADCVAELPPSPAGNGEIGLTPGWQLIGPIRGGQLDAEVTGLGFWGIENGAYIAPPDNWAKPTKGYWLYSDGEKTVVVP